MSRWVEIKSRQTRRTHIVDLDKVSCVINDQSLPEAHPKTCSVYVVGMGTITVNGTAEEFIEEHFPNRAPSIPTVVRRESIGYKAGYQLGQIIAIVVIIAVGLVVCAVVLSQM